MNTYGYIYIRNHYSYNDYHIYKLGETIDLFSRDFTYTTGEFIKGKYILILKMNSHNSKNVEKIIKNYFKNYNKRNTGGTEFFDIKIKDEIKFFLNKTMIKFTEINIEDINKQIIINEIIQNPKLKQLFENFINKYKNNNNTEDDVTEDVTEDDVTEDDVTEDNNIKIINTNMELDLKYKNDNNIFKLPPLSNEQEKIVNNILKNNIIVDSVAGSGKTTTNLHIAIKHNNKKILLLTYNAKLKLETREKLKQCNINNMEVHSYHSFCVKYYDDKAYTDTEIKKIINNNIESKEKFNYDIIIIDEVQDMTDTYFYLICKIYQQNKNKNDISICVIGDKNQCIYQYNGSDDRFITMADKIFNYGYIEKKWCRYNLSNSYRITHTMAEFLNNCILKEQRIFSKKNNNYKPKYYICDTLISGKNYKPLDIIKEYIFDLKYKPDDIFILAPSVRSKDSPSRILENSIKKNFPTINIHVPISDDEKIDKDILKNKLTFCSYHQSKGLERKIVIVFGIDSSYFEYYKFNVNKNICPNEIYVALTRATEQLILIHSDNKEYINFIDKDKLKDYTDFIDCRLSKEELFQQEIDKINCQIEKKKKNKKLSEEDIEKFKEEKITKLKNKELNCEINSKNDDKKDYIQNIDIVNLLKHIENDIIEENFKNLTIKKINKNINKLSIPDKIKIDKKTKNNKNIYSYESVNEINNTALIALFQYSKQEKISILDCCTNIENKYKDIYNSRKNINLKKYLKEQQPKLDDIKNKKTYKENILYISAIYNVIKSKLLFKAVQINNFNWINNDISDKCINNMKDLLISEKSVFNNYINYTINIESKKINLLGYIDCEDKDNNSLWKFYCCNDIDKIYYLQLIFYAYIYNKNNKNNNIKNLYIYNIKNNNLEQIEMNIEIIENIVANILKHKYSTKKNISDDLFIKKLNYRKNIILEENITEINECRYKLLNNKLTDNDLICMHSSCVYDIIQNNDIIKFIDEIKILMDIDNSITLSSYNSNLIEQFYKNVKTHNKL